MIDRGIGIAGIALALILFVLQYYFPRLPKWLIYLGIGCGIFLLGLSLGLIVADHRNINAVQKPYERASLKLHIYGDDRVPERISAENIFRWYLLKSKAVLIDNGAGKDIPITSTLFISFDKDVEIRTLHVGSPDVQLPLHEVKEFNQRYAIVVFMGNIPAGTLEIAVVQ